jgi:hypothetical protein
MPEYTKLNYKLSQDIQPVLGLVHFSRRNENTVLHDGNWRYKGFMLYQTAWIAGLGTAAMLYFL